MSAAEKLELEHEDLTAREAVEYLKLIGMRISLGTLYNRIYKGTGPERERRNGAWYFKKKGLDAWKRHETEKFGAYEK